MKVKVTRGAIKYNGTVFQEGDTFLIEEKDFSKIQENVEVLEESSTEKVPDPLAGENEEDKKNYKKMKKEELLKEASERGIAIPEKATNVEIIELLEGEGE